MNLLNIFNKKKKKGGEKDIGKKNKKGDADITVKVCRAPGKVVEIALNGGRTVDDALKAAGLVKKESEVIQVNSEDVDDIYYELEDGDRVVLAKNIQGGR